MSPVLRASGGANPEGLWESLGLAPMSSQRGDFSDTTRLNVHGLSLAQGTPCALNAMRLTKVPHAPLIVFGLSPATGISPTLNVTIQLCAACFRILTQVAGTPPLPPRFQVFSAQGP